jgi:hypothetical protein
MYLSNYIYLQGWIFAAERGYTVWGIRVGEWLQSQAESVQNRMFLPSPTLNLTFACKRLAMFCVERIAETMPCQVGDKEPVNSGIPLIK